jgi:hypothetical protein
MKTKKVDRVFAVISIVITTIVLVAGLWVVGRLYKSTTDYRYIEGTVVTDTYGWITVVQDNGERWDFDDDKLQCGDRVKVKLDCNDTATIYDDKYVSYTLLSESEE